jgi:aldehyde:ferredoxin oxidoreductase
MPFVYAGKYLHIDLSTGAIDEHIIDETDVRAYLLGSGYAANLFLAEMDPSRPWDDPASPLLVFNGLLSGTFAPTGCRSSWCARSPLTGIWGESNMGGHWGAELRFAGYDGLLITGRAERPALLWIDGPKVELRAASHLWGQNHYAVFDQVRAETGAKAQVACIGVAGERLVRYATVMQGGIAHARTAGRTGMGAVMGSKNLKAIAVRGPERPAYHDPQGFRAAVKADNALIKDGAYGLSMLGTAGSVPNTEKYGDLPLRNWRDGSWDKANDISGQRIAETIFAKHTFCFACPIGCGKTVQIAEGPYAGTQGHGPEYETLGGFGGLLLNADLDSIAHINMLCNDYGLDTISTSGCIAFAIEAVESGLLSRADLDGLDLTWGNAAAIVACVHKIGQRKGVGDFLAEGMRIMAARLGPASQPSALHVKGLEMPYHDPRAFVSMAVNYATANRGACHMEAMTYYEGYGIEIPGMVFRPGADQWQARLQSEGSGVMAARYQNFQSVYNPLGLCKFIERGPIGPAQLAELVNQALGWGWKAADVLLTGERIFNLKRLINMRYGVSAADDVLPERLATLPRPSGGAAGVLPDMKLMMAEYYTARGWNPVTGAPQAERLRMLTLL